MKKMLWCLNLVFTASLVVLQPARYLITKGIMAVDPVLADVLQVVLEVSKYGRYVVAFANLIQKTK